MFIGQVNDFVSKGNSCNVCYRTTMLKRRTEFQMSKCFKMPEKHTTKVVMSLPDLRECLEGDRNKIWRELIEKHEIANIMKDPRDRQVLFRARKHVGLICNKTLNECIASENEQREVKKSDLKNLSLCMECKCPWGIGSTRGKCLRQEMTNSSREVFRLCKESTEECRCRKGFTVCDLKATESRGSCRICINKALKHLQRSKCIQGRVIKHNESEFGPVSGLGTVGKDLIRFSPTEGESFVFDQNPVNVEHPKFGEGSVNFENPKLGEGSVNFPGSQLTTNVVPSDKEESNGVNNDTITNQEDDSDDDSDTRVQFEDKKASMSIPMAAGSGGLLLILIITSLIVMLKKRRRSSDENVQRENSWYFDIVPSRHKKGDSTHSSVTRTVFD